MRDTYGMPGPGGSLGMCALCGNTFISSILLGESVVSGHIGDTEIFAHKECVARYVKDGRVDVEALPDSSPLKPVQTTV